MCCCFVVSSVSYRGISTDKSADISVDCRSTYRSTYRSIYRPTLHRHSTDIMTDTSTDSRQRNRPIYRSTPPIGHMIRFFLAALKIRCIQYYRDAISLLTWKLTSLVILSSDSKLSNGEIKAIRRSLPGGTSGQCMRRTLTVVCSLMEHLKALGKISSIQKFGARLSFEGKRKENKPRRTNQIEKEDQQQRKFSLHMEHPPNFVCTQIHSPLRHPWPPLKLKQENSFGCFMTFWWLN